MEERLAREDLFSGRVVRLVLDTVRRPDGSQARREVILHPGGAAILPVADDGRILLVNQYRHPVEASLWEIPAGKLEPGERPLDCARRELVEETGYEAAVWTPRLSFRTSPGFTDERLTLFVAHGLRRITDPRAGEIDRCTLLPQDELLTRIEDGGITDAKTILAILLWITDTKCR